MSTTTQRKDCSVPAPQRARQRTTLWQPSRTGRAVAASVSVVLSTVLLASVAVGMAWTGDATPTLADIAVSAPQT